MACLNSSNGYYRFILLFFNALVTFGTYFCFDMPSALQDSLQASDICNMTDTDYCKYGLGLSSRQYNLLYAVTAWTNAVVVIAAGVLIDKLGNPVGLFLFSGFSLLGSCLFAVGTMLRGTAAMFPLLLVGRLFIGSGNGMTCVVQDRIASFWFRDKELAFALGVTLSFSRIGTVLNFLLTKDFANKYGLVWAFWGGAFLVALSFLSAIVTSILDVTGIKQLQQKSLVKSESKKFQVTDIHFSSYFWLLALSCMFFSNGLYAFVADASEYIKIRGNFSDTSVIPSYYAGAVYDISLLLIPFFGLVIDFIGMRGILALCCAIFSIPVFTILAFTQVSALVCTLWFGVTYSLASATIWPSIPLVVPPATIGTAFGLTISMQMIGIGISNVIVGELAGDPTNYAEKIENWKRVMIFLICNFIACAFTTSLLNIVDKKKGGILNESRRKKKKRLTLEESLKNLVQATDNVNENYPLIPQQNE